MSGRKPWRWLSGARPQIAIGVVLFVMMAGLLVLSSRTGLDEYERATGQLDHLEGLNLRLDGAVAWSAFEFQMDFDSITRSQQELRAAAQTFHTSFPDRGSEISDVIQRKVAAVEDFKTSHSVLRNSRAIASQIIRQLWNDASSAEIDAETLFAVERAFLNLLSRRDPPSIEAIRSLVAEFDDKSTSLAGAPQWPYLSAHLLTLAGHLEEMGTLMRQLYFVPVVPTIESQTEVITAELSAAAARAARYRSMLFAVAVVLLAFSVLMATRVRQYLQMIRRTNDELETRVAQRTKELAEVNEALRSEIGERKNVQSQLDIARKLESIGQLAAGIAHEVNTPTQYVRDNVMFLEGVWAELQSVIDAYEQAAGSKVEKVSADRAMREEPDIAYLREEVPLAFSEARSGLEQISKIVLAMKEFSHPSAEGLEHADVNKALESTVTIARNEWKYVAELVLDLDPKLPPVPCNLSALNQAVLNLVVNASQAIAEAGMGTDTGRIVVSSQQRNGFVEIGVEDNGPGIHDSFKERIFDPFFTTKEVGKGTGQGLCIAHQIVHQQHSGALTVERSRYGGAKFVIRLPIRQTETTAPKSKATDRLTA